MQRIMSSFGILQNQSVAMEIKLRQLLDPFFSTLVVPATVMESSQARVSSSSKKKEKSSPEKDKNGKGKRK